MKTFLQQRSTKWFKPNILGVSEN